jgi:hypothetical protein
VHRRAAGLWRFGLSRGRNRHNAAGRVATLALYFMREMHGRAPVENGSSVLASALQQV